MIPDEWMNVSSAAAWIILLIPFWMGSVWIERWTLVKKLPDIDPAMISVAIVRANLASYSIFLVFGVIALTNEISDLPNQKQRFKELRERQKVSLNQQGEQITLSNR